MKFKNQNNSIQHQEEYTVVNLTKSNYKIHAVRNQRLNWTDR